LELKTLVVALLERIRLHNFIPIFKLLYKDLRNDILINGKIGTGYNLGNGVKQGDALSCSLFILAMEPLIRNINNSATNACQDHTCLFVEATANPTKLYLVN
jgi:hypothetical protein